LLFRDFLKEAYKLDIPGSQKELWTLLKNMNLATDDEQLNLAAVLLFVERPEWIKPQFIVKAVCYPGNTIHPTEYLDSEDFDGQLRKMGFWGRAESAGINRHRVGDERALHERRSCSIMAPSHASAIREEAAKR
jgi:hypothetical protein